MTVNWHKWRRTAAPIAITALALFLLVGSVVAVVLGIEGRKLLRESQTLVAGLNTGTGPTFQKLNALIDAVSPDIQATAAGVRKVVDETVLPAQPKFRQMISDSERLLLNGRVGVKAWRDEWESPEYQKARYEYMLVGNQLIVFLDELRRELIPPTKKAIEDVGGVAVDTRSFINHFDREINANLLPAATLTVTNLAKAATTFGTSLDRTSASIELIMREGTLTIDEIKSFIADPNWDKALAEIAGTVTDLHQTSAYIRDGAARVPSLALIVEGIASDVRKISSTTSRYQKLVLFVGLLGTVIRTVF